MKLHNTKNEIYTQKWNRVKIAKIIWYFYLG